MIPVTFCGRTFTEQEVELMRVVTHDYAGLGVTEIARTVCELLQWERPNGGLKNHECRQLLERLEAEGLLRLPSVRKLGGTGPRRVDVSEPRCENRLPAWPANASRWSWPWWKAKERAGCGASWWNAITT